ncbi:MAG: MATE family efflux transporter, partial [Clostridia bacterium]|nr:MATE family efflux transporter [Clostridia bacterium]
MALFRSKNINMTEGNILPSIIRYSIPIVIGGVIQVLFNAADLAVVGNFSQSKTAAGAAVGATGSFTALIVNLFMGISVGVNVILARSLGSNDEERSQRIV